MKKQAKNMFFRLSAWQVLRLVQSGGLFVIVAMISILWTRNWYETSDNVNGIIVEIHGALFEVLFLSLLVEWHTRKRDQIQSVNLVNTLCYLLYEAATSCLSKIDDDYISTEKNYIYFGERMSIGRSYKLMDFLDKVIFLLSEMYPKVEELRQRHLEGAEILLNGIRKVCDGSIISVADKDIISVMLSVQEAANELIASLKRHGAVKNEEKAIENLLNESRLLVIRSIELKELIEKRADRVESREEHSQTISKELLAMQEVIN